MSAPDGRRRKHTDAEDGAKVTEAIKYVPSRVEDPESSHIIDGQVLARREALGCLLETETEAEIERRVNEILEQFKHDFDRGIVMIDGEATLKDYEKALKKDGKAGQNWEGKGGLKERLRDYLLEKVNGVTRLELAEKMPGGPCLIGIHADGTPAIRQRSREIVNVVITNEGESVLLPHEEVVQFIEKQGGEYAKAVEIVRAVKAKGYRVPPDFPDYKGRRYKVKGLVAASDAVMGGNYVENPVAEGPRSKEWRSAMLECPDDIDDGKLVRNITSFNYSPSYQAAQVFDDYASVRHANVGAVLWL